MSDISRPKEVGMFGILFIRFLGLSRICTQIAERIYFSSSNRIFKRLNTFFSIERRGRAIMPWIRRVPSWNIGPGDLPSWLPFVGAFVKQLREATVSLVCLSARNSATSTSRICVVLPGFVDSFQFWLKSDKNNVFSMKMYVSPW